MARVSSNALDTGDQFPLLNLQMVNGDIFKLPDDHDYSVSLNGEEAIAENQ